jgi:hypothetical protein
MHPRELMGYLGLVPSESSTGDTVNRGGITKAGNGRARRILVEAAWSYRYPPRVSREKQIKMTAAPRVVREIAWKAQMRLCGRFRSLTRKGKRPRSARLFEPLLLPPLVQDWWAEDHLARFVLEPGEGRDRPRRNHDAARSWSDPT